MTLSDNKIRYALTLEKTDKAKLEKIAKQENRSLNNLIETILKTILINKVVFIYYLYLLRRHFDSF